MVIDLSAMNRVEVLDRRTRLVRVEAGAHWASVAQALALYGLAISSGEALLPVYSTVEQALATVLTVARTN